jgi:hypothetical protein
MGDVRTLAVQAVAMKVLADQVKARDIGVRRELQAALDVGDRKTATLDDGTKVGAITYANGRVTARVNDEQAFTEWVLANYPDEVVPLVRSSFRDAILKATTGAGQPMTPDGNLDVPGVVLGASAPYLTVKPNPDAIPALVDAIRANQLLSLDPGDPPHYDPMAGE